MRTLLIATVIATTATCALAAEHEIAVVSGQAGYDDITERFLQKSGISYDMLGPDEVVADRIAAYRLLIFPYNPIMAREHRLAPVAEWVREGGKLIYMSGIPSELQELLGIEQWESRTPDDPGEFSTMVFTDDRPPGFPAEVFQESPNARLVSATNQRGRIIANWHDRSGEDIGYGAVVTTEDTVWTSHVFWHGADVEQQRHLLVASICYLLPDRARPVVEGVLAAALADTGYEDLDALVAAAEGNPVGRELAAEATEVADEAARLLESDTPIAALEPAWKLADVAQGAAAALYPSRPYELRGAWMHPDDAFDYEAVAQEMAAANFNAMFPIVCGPNYAKYPSDYVPQYTERDHVAECIEAAHARGIEVHTWKANWQTSPSRNPELVQQYIDEGRMVLSLEQAKGEEERSSYGWSQKWLDPSDERNRQLEFDMMMELVENYDVDGIHFDFMRYPGANYCYCDRCRRKFEQWAGVTVENWPDDCAGDGPLADRYFDWRRHLQTSLVERIAEGARQRDPDIKLSLAARASMTGSYRNDAQDWVTWAHQHYLDLLCPMDYTASVQVLREKVQPQVEAIDGAIPVYAGIGVSSGRSDSPVNLSRQICAARELGADGFLIFALSPFARSMLPTIARGVTAEAVTVMPHHSQAASAEFDLPETPGGIPPRTYAPGDELPVTIYLRAAQPDIERMTVRALTMPATGGESVPLTDRETVTLAQHRLTVAIPATVGAHSVIVEGTVAFPGGREEAFYLRSLPLRVVSSAEYGDLLALTGPPAFATEAVHAGVFVDCYGSAGILEALRATDGVEAMPLAELSQDYLAPCDVVVLPQPSEAPDRVDADAIAALGEFVSAGGGLMAMRDVIGAWIYDPILPDAVKADGTVVEGRAVRVATEHPATEGLTVGETLTHAHDDHLLLAPGEGATVLMTDSDGRPVVAAAQVEQGRYVACGFAIGRTATLPDAPPTGFERDLLVSAVRWLAEK
ncbi:MAG: family 10 glycosylhydrolase [Armatimonadota bacterium]|nr:family 10 glycosylhydrolase [Armatimonadota bacterium]